MGKRGAEDQLTKDDVESGRGGRDDSDNETDIARDAPKEVLATRKIRGMPKRKIAAGAPVAATTSAFGSAESNTSSFGGFGASAAPPAGSSDTPSTAPTFFTPASKQPTFAFGTSSAATASDTAAPKAFSGFSFGGSSATPASASSTSTAAPTVLAPVTTAGAPKTANDKTPFSGFSFGAPSITPKANSSTVATSSTPAFAPASSSSSFGAFGETSESSPASAFATAVASVAASPPNAASSGTPSSDGKPEPPNTSTTSEALKEEQKQIEYLTSIRGLNESVVQALSVKIRDEPFINLASALESVKAEYDKYLETIKKKAGKSVLKAAAEPQARKRDASSMDDTPMDAPAKKKTPEAAKPSFSMPAPPSMPSAVGFKLPTAPTSSTSSSTGGFKPSLPTSIAAPTLPAVGGFKLPAAPSNGAEKSDSAPVGFKPTLPASDSSAPKPSPFAGFTFGQTTEKKDAPAKPAVAPAESVSSISFPTFGASPSTPSAPDSTQTTAEKRPSSQASLFAQSVIDKQAQDKEKEQAAKQDAPATPSSTPKQSSIFAIKPIVKAAIGDSMVVPSPPSSGGTPSFLFKAPPSSATSTTPSKLPSFSFNMGATGSPAAPTTPGTPGSSGTFTFAAAKPRSTSAAFRFGAQKEPTKGVEEKDAQASTTPSKPIASGFSFGANAPRAPPRQPMFAPPSAANGSQLKPTFSFGPTSTFSDSAPADNSAANTDSEEAPADAGPQADLTTGEGEEDEETLWKGRVQVGTFGKSGDGSGPMSWGDWKVCVLRLNRERNPTNGAQPMRRILARVDPSGAIAQNFSLRSLTDMSLFTETSYKMTVAETGGLKQVALRFGKKKPGFDPVAMMDKFKSAVQTERETMGLPALPSLK